MADTLANPVLTASDRCDRCTAQAQVLVVLKSGELMFCGHHHHVHLAALQTTALAVIGGN